MEIRHDLPLAGIRVIELSHMVMGPTCGLILADLGADVIKVEPPDGDKTRHLTGSGAGFFSVTNRNKRSIAVDLKTADGLALVRRLIAKADVLVENFRAGSLDAIGLDYDSLAKTNPGLIYYSAKGFLAGPYDNRTALDEMAQMMGGLAYMTGPPGRPLRAGASVNDIMGGMFGVIGILSALRERDRSGEGELVTSALFENCVYLCAQHMAQFAATGMVPAPMPAREAALAVYDIFDCADAHQLFIGIVSDSQWQRFCEDFDLIDWLDDPDLADNAGRCVARPAFMPRLREIFGQIGRDDLAARCVKLGLPFAPINKPTDLLDDEHLAATQGFLRTRMENGSYANLPALPLTLSGQRPGLRRDVPRPGEQSAEIAREAGYTDDEIARLINEGVLAASEA